MPSMVKNKCKNRDDGHQSTNGGLVLLCSTDIPMAWNEPQGGVRKPVHCRSSWTLAGAQAGREEIRHGNGSSATVTAGHRSGSGYVSDVTFVMPTGVDVSCLHRKFK